MKIKFFSFKLNLKDLVKSHLTSAVKEEIVALKNQIKQLNEICSRLEQENQLLKHSVSPETLKLIENRMNNGHEGNSLPHEATFEQQSLSGQEQQQQQQQHQQQLQQQHQSVLSSSQIDKTVASCYRQDSCCE